MMVMVAVMMMMMPTMSTGYGWHGQDTEGDGNRQDRSDSSHDILLIMEPVDSNRKLPS